MRKFFTLFVWVGIASSALQAQEDQTTTYNNWGSLGKSTISSPSVAALSKFTDVPVSYYTGTPNISIPLYTIKTGKITWPITLDYNGTGIRVNENSGNVGLEWNIHAEGAIMQNILGIKDNSSYQTDGLGYTSAALLPNNPTSANLMNILSLDHTDGVPDLYMYNFGNYSGKFIVANDVKTMPKKNISISSYLDNNSQKCWKIIGEDGKIYIFSAMETVVNRSAAGAPETNNWFLTKVTDANGIDSLVFQYEDTYSETDIARDYVLDVYRDTLFIGYSVDMQPNDPPIPGHLTLYSQRNIGKQLKRILFNNGSIEYDIAYNDRQDLSGYQATTDFHVPRVKNLFIKDLNGAVIKTIHFEQDYYLTPGSTDLDGKRLRLASISFVPHLEDLNTPVEEKYTFQYNPIALPLKSSNSMDHWGYFNNQNNLTLIPTMHLNGMDYYGANRETNPSYVMAGLLEKITYPTGGSSNYAWEAHRANNPSGTPILIHVDSNINLQLLSSHNDNSLSTMSSSTVSIPDNDSFNNLDVSFLVSAGYPVGANSQTITHAASKGIVYRLDGTTSTVVAALAFAYNSSGTYSANASVTLERGKTYYVVAQTTGPIGCSVNAKLTIAWPKIGTSGSGGISYVGGCRIHSITLHDQTGNPDMVKSYTYPDVQIFNSPVYYTKFYEYLQSSLPGDENDPGTGMSCSFNERQGYMLNSSSFSNIGAGNHVGYSYVTEKNGTTGGSTTYSFTNFEYGFPSELDASWRRGLLTDVKIYDNVGTEVKEKISHNKRITSETYAGHTVRNMGVHPCYSPAYTPSNFPVHYDQKVYSFPVDWVYVDTTEEIDYVTGIHTLSIDNYDNPQHLQVTRHTSFNSDGSKITAFIKYPTDFTISSTPLYSNLDGIKLLQDKHMHNTPLEMYVQKLYAGAATPVTISAKVNNFERAPIAFMNVPDRVMIGSQSSIDINSDGISDFQPLSISNNVLNLDSRYTEKVRAKEYDDEGNVWELISNKSNSTGAIYGYRNGLKIAEVENNDTSITMAFTSFEYNQPGKWSYASNGVIETDHFTGTKCLNLTTNPGLKIIFPSASWTDLPPVTPNGAGLNGRFIISYWFKNGTVQVNGTSATKTGITANGWTYAEHTIINPTGPILVTGTALIDEIKFHRESSLMKSYNYDPLIGMTSFDDESNHIIFYEYDNMGRLSTEKDVYGNILKTNKYQYQGQQ